MQGFRTLAITGKIEGNRSRGRQRITFIESFKSLAIACEDGTYGPDCNQPCSANCVQSTDVCNSIDGVCNGGCKPGYQAPLCNEPCPVGQFGLDCLQSCSDNCVGRENVCNHVTGECDSGCDPGYNTKQCNVSCEPGTYGKDCMETCSDHCAGESRSCNFVTGFCDQGCKAGYLMPLCTDEDESCGSGQLGIGIIIGVLSTVAVAAILLGVFMWRRRKTNKSRNEEVKGYPQADLSDGSGLENFQGKESRPGQRDQHVLVRDGEKGNNHDTYEEVVDHYDRPESLPGGGPYEIPFSAAKSAHPREKIKKQKKRAAEGRDAGRPQVYQNTGARSEM
ncbi:multiple epidermal growth factor-like domains 10 [Plakobranchus ocellatus]|uniref:Multiple epidermal growth factor-like domains 10 n=1 Tax=Plakobranchus ocellatus TaxID=259542 RepID=A0AAV4AEF3_9GAST|nr:multiple epidermal growth factor-like domains 10 [Plakobranchus ocellatus]